LSRVDLETVQRLGSAANDDPEFGLAARFWTTVLRFDIGDDTFLIHVGDGRVTWVDEPVGPAKRRSASSIVVAAPAGEWDELLSLVPRPFYQDLWGATNHHGFEVLGDLEEFSQYYRAISRMLELLRVIVDGDHRCGEPGGRADGPV
jgi:hypothetical protein